MRRAAQRVIMEFTELNNQPEDGFTVSASDPGAEWNVHMHGPEGSPFEGGTFELLFVFDNYPFKAPKITFQTKIYHPNISDAGEICHEIYESDWVPTKKVRSIMGILRSMLISPNPASPIREEIAQQFAQDYDGYCKTAREWTVKHASL